MESTRRSKQQIKRDRVKKKKREERLAWVTLLLLVACAIVGFNRATTDLTPYFSKLFPGASRFEGDGYETYLAFGSEERLIGCVTTSAYNGFGGPLKVAVAIDTMGAVLGIEVVEHRETPSWFDRVQQSGLAETLVGKTYKDPITLYEDVDGVTGATYTVRAIVTSVKEATLDIAESKFNIDITPYLPQERIKFGIPEISLVLLLLVATIGTAKVPARHKNTLKWTIMVLGMIFVGFVYNHPLTLVDINKLIMGYWPDVYHQLYWYLLVFGIILIFLTTGRNTYCRYICPFGAVQECVGVVGGAKGLHSKTYHNLFDWTRRVVVLLAIMIALVYRNPGLSSYEVYGTLFNLLGTNREVLFLGVVLLFSLFIKRPWCNYLCPIPVIEHYARFIYKKIQQPITMMRRKREAQYPTLETK